MYKTGVYKTRVQWIEVYKTGVFKIGVYKTGIHKTGVYETGLHETGLYDISDLPTFNEHLRACCPVQQRQTLATETLVTYAT